MNCLVIIGIVKDKFNYMNTMVYVMMPSLISFFVLTAGFYVLHGYTSANQIDELKRKFHQVEIS